MIVHIYNHYRMIYGTIITILAANIITYTEETQVIYLADNRDDTIYGNKLSVLYCINVGIENNGVVADAKDPFGYQLSMLHIEIAWYYDQAAFRLLYSQVQI